MRDWKDWAFITLAVVGFIVATGGYLAVWHGIATAKCPSGMHAAWAYTAGVICVVRPQ